ncbi:hypothetical protein I4U23_019962 [Adineta vaga]|nr:hypothetical protein I4U23_019962 [Adineta vaga]
MLNKLQGFVDRSGGLTQTITFGTSVSKWKDSTLKCKTFEYRVDDYHLRIKFLEENKLFWEYLSAPYGLTGKNATEQIERTQIRTDMIILRWKEADGINVIDVFDLDNMVMYANFVTIDGERISAQGNLMEVKSDC